MRKVVDLFLLQAIVLLAASISYAQEVSSREPITIRKGFFGPSYMYRNAKVSPWFHFESIMEDCGECLAQVHRGKTFYVLAMTMSSVGGFMIGWPVGQAIARKEDVSWELAGIGGGIAVVGIIFGVMSNKCYKKAVNLYNAGAGPNVSQTPPGLQIDLSSRKIGLALHF